MTDTENIFTQVILLAHLSWVILLEYILFITHYSFYKTKHLFTNVK